MRILYVGNPVDRVRTGGDSVNLRNITLLQRLPGVRLDFEVPARSVPLIWKAMLWSGRMTPRTVRRILERIGREPYDYVFLSQSLMGRLACRIKRRFPEVRIVCCYHNIEKQYAGELIRVSGRKHLLHYWSAAYNERLTARFGDIHLVLNDRDAQLLEKCYGRRPDLVLPAAYDDAFDETKCREAAAARPADGPVWLFVGSAFFANIEGVRWFLDAVFSHVPGRLIVAGRGMDAYAGEFGSERVEVRGFVEDLSDLYYAADAVVSPILSGGGMKTKTAEALMYGRTIVATPEALEGYEAAPTAVRCCRTATDFISALHEVASSGRQPFNEESRRSFLRNYDFKVLETRFARLFRMPAIPHSGQPGSNRSVIPNDQ